MSKINRSHQIKIEFEFVEITILLKNVRQT